MNDLYIFDTGNLSRYWICLFLSELLKISSHREETLKWRQSVTKGPTPAPLRGHTAIALVDFFLNHNTNSKTNFLSHTVLYDCMIVFVSLGIR
jgi:hypothetical protein